jgi:hypothetical protein
MSAQLAKEYPELHSRLFDVEIDISHNADL